MKNMQVSLSSSSLSELERELLHYADSVERASKQAAIKLAGIAQEEARANAKVDTGALASSIAVKETQTGADVVCSAPYAAFVEFGTGIGTPSTERADARAMAEAGYVVNASGRGSEGWVYPKDGGFRFTHGQSGAGFMAKGAEEARVEVIEVVRGELQS
ncbi:HK97 gp10 family phage protein [Collinsella sp. AGMB00827]|uniref:HK97 gp10 family phage protein n=1 Tax=Collinsella ureilytica TaxID=2869515 RepID=A0ABS7MPQ1_9ACTN|nr:HK97-gp10 family putative phage morphogenesis protein [Collinsella urealyticum]MBY4798350.1 HK97 gp10 family phage protein [Collinsella urealyticum]